MVRRDLRRVCLRHLDWEHRQQFSRGCRVQYCSHRAEVAHDRLEGVLLALLVATQVLSSAGEAQVVIASEDENVVGHRGTLGAHDVLVHLCLVHLYLN